MHASGSPLNEKWLLLVEIGTSQQVWSVCYYLWSFLSWKETLKMVLKSFKPFGAGSCMLMLECQSHSLQFVVSVRFIQSLKKLESFGKWGTFFHSQVWGKRHFGQGLGKFGKFMIMVNIFCRNMIKNSKLKVKLGHASVWVCVCMYVQYFSSFWTGVWIIKKMLWGGSV